jgi:hypothetical protein
MEKKWIVSLSAVVLLAASIGFSITIPRAQRVVPGEESDLKPRTAAVYSALFHMVVDLEKQALELESEGAKGETLRSYVQTQANLTDDQVRKLGAIAAACVEQVGQLDARALEVIQKSQSQFPGGRIPKGSQVPPPSPELKVLQQERDQIILAARDSLSNALGAASFGNVEQFATHGMGLSVRPTTPR